MLTAYVHSGHFDVAHHTAVLIQQALLLGSSCCSIQQETCSLALHHAASTCKLWQITTPGLTAWTGEGPQSSGAEDEGACGSSGHDTSPHLPRRDLRQQRVLCHVQEGRF